jgi:tetratricopeptide (TPR) repeat protein
MRVHRIGPAVAVLACLAGLAGGCGYAAGNLALTRGDYQGAEAEFSAILARSPDDAVAMSRLGETYYRAGRFREAAGEYQAALAHRPDDPGDQLGLGLALVGAGERDRGFAVLKSFVHPDVYRVQEAVRDEAGLLEPRPDLPLAEVERRLGQAWQRGQELHNHERRSETS